MTIKKTSELRKGDKVRVDIGIMLVTEDARPAGKPNEFGQCYIATSTCIEGAVKGYFRPGTPWKIQGNDNAEWTLVDKGEEQ